MQRTSKALFRELDRLKAIFARLSERLDDAGRRFRKSGVPLPESLVSELADFNKGLEDLAGKVLELGTELSLPEEQLADLSVAALDSVDRSLRQIAEIEERQEKATSGRSAVALADRISSIVHRDRPTFPPLLECQARATELRNQITSLPLSEGCLVAQELTESTEALSNLLCLIEERSILTDEQCLNIHEIVAESFGKDLAIAALRGKLELPPLSTGPMFPAREGSRVSSPRGESLPKEFPEEYFSAGLPTETEPPDISSKSLPPLDGDVKHAIEEFLQSTASEMETAVMETIKLQQVADLYRNEGRYSLAGPLYEKLLLAQRQLYGTEDPRLSRTRRTLEEIHCIQVANSRPQAVSQRFEITGQGETGARPRRAAISGAMVFWIAAIVLGYATIYYWPINAEALLQHLRPGNSQPTLALSHPSLSQAAEAQPARALAQPKVALKQRESPIIRITRNADEPLQDLAQPHAAARQTAPTKQEPEPPQLSGFIGVSYGGAEETRNTLIDPASPVIAAPPPNPPSPERIRVGGQLSAAKLVVQTEPLYPSLARQERIEGQVRLEASIRKDGSVENVKLISGDPLLSTAALMAVKKWRYQPTLLNGAPVEVVTTVTVNFKLSK